VSLFHSVAHQKISSLFEKKPLAGIILSLASYLLLLLLNQRWSKWKRGPDRGSWPFGYRDRGFESRSNHVCCPHISVMCYPAEVEALRGTDAPSRKSYQMPNWLISSEVILDWKRSQGLIHKSDDDDDIKPNLVCSLRSYSQPRRSSPAWMLVIGQR
jgi:hypothetical protein